MLPHHQKSLGRDWTTPWENLQRCCWNRHISSCMRWPGHYSRAPYPYFSSRHFSLNWKPPCLFESRTQFQSWNWRPDNLSQTSLIHLSSYIMNSEGDEPSSKRRKHQGTIKRHWEYMCNHNKEKTKILGEKNGDPVCDNSENKFDFSVMSYNILSQDLLEDNSHLYRHCRQPVLHWSFRFPNILKEIKHFDADVLCLQEVQEDHYGTEIRPSLESLGSDLTQTQVDKTEVLVTDEKLSSNLQHHFSLSSVYSHYFPETGIPEVTTCHSRSAITVDYIFYSAEKEGVAGQQGAGVALVGGLKLLARLSLLTEQDLWTVNGLPNENNSSDHLPLLAKFRLDL